MTISINDTAAACRDLGFVVRYRDGEYRLARPLSAYRSYGRGARQVQELEAHYTDDPRDCVGTAQLWYDNLNGTRERLIVGKLIRSC